MRCRGAHRLALPPFLSGFLCSGLLRVAPYCVPGIGESTRLAPRLALPRRGDVVGDTVLRSGMGGTPRGRIARRSLLHLRSPTCCLWVNRTAAWVAEALGTDIASLYCRFANQDELRGWDFGRAIGEIELPTPYLTRWREQAVTATADRDSGLVFDAKK
jgi:hypothetical protein